MKFVLTLLLFSIGIFVISSAQNAIPRSLGSVKLSNVAYVEAYIDQGDEDFIGDRYTLYISTFNPINPYPDPKYMVRGFGRNLTSIDGWEFEEIDRTAQWPNSPDRIPFEVFNTTGIIWTSGFLVPPKTHGRLEIYDTSKNPPNGPFNIASSDGNNDWSYHRVLWKDMDGDGDLDALTARFRKPIIGVTRKQLVWLENPGLPIDDTPTTGWLQHIINDGGTDVHFRNVKLSSDGQEYDSIVSAEFFNEKLMLYYSLNGNWSDWDQVVTLPIDTTVGQTFDVYVDDFNKDGKDDILISAYNHSRGHVFAYEIPQNFTSGGQFVKHTLADGFIANFIIGGQSMTPGSPKTFYPSTAYEEEVLPGGGKRKPYIMLSGDDDGRHYILEPVSDDPADWTYNKHILVDTEKTTSGKFTIADFDGDGYTDIICAGYSAGTLYAFTYAPDPEQ